MPCGCAAETEPCACVQPEASFSQPSGSALSPSGRRPSCRTNSPKRPQSSSVALKPCAPRPSGYLRRNQPGLPENRDRHSPTNSKKAMAILQQRVVDPVTQEIVCLCTVKVHEHDHDFQIAQYADQQILMSNVGEALLQSYPDYELILNACLKAERLCHFKIQKHS